MIYFFIKLFNKKLNGFVLLRSDGYKEYSVKYGYLGRIIYQFFFESILKNLKLISVSKNLSNISKYKPLRIYPSEIDNEWRKNLKKINTKKANLFYLGRFKKEKGIFSLLELVNKLTINFNLDIVGIDKIKRSQNKKVHYHLETSNKKKL